jgi:ATP-dependent DNA helicase RecG
MIDKPLKEVIRTNGTYLKALREMGVSTVYDLLMNFPWRYSDESEFVSICNLSTRDALTVRVILENVYTTRTRNGKSMTRGRIKDETGSADVMWFNQSYLKRVLKDGMEVILTGKIKWSGSKAVMMSPSYEIPKKGQDLLHAGRLVPVYHESGRITSKWLREKLWPLMYMVQFLEDPLPEEIVERYGLISLSEAVRQIHFPDSQEELLAARSRLGFEELFQIQLKALFRKKEVKELSVGAGKVVDVSKEVVGEYLSGLPFELTGAQKRSLAEIMSDMSKGQAMSRLLEGDVGSGKTVVAAGAIFAAVKSGYQAAIMVPTEILAKQHFQGFLKILGSFGFNIQLLVGSMTKKQKEEVVNSLKTGVVDIVVGTHALVQDKVGFKNLGIAVVDEQHRFGVNQRAVLKSFGSPHMLSMTATPIPRTLALTLYGDQDLSIIDEKPAGRKDIITRRVPASKRKDAYLWIEEQVRQGRQVYIVCPLVEESEALEVKSAVSEYERLQSEVFPGLRLGLLHGRMKQSEKDDVMGRFSDGELDVLVSTTVIEVGIDVPNASIIVIEASERFGLAQLHQLRGRVGRGAHQSYCFLFPESNSDSCRKRMKAMVDYTDGFKLAEIDLELRGPGEVYGVRQSGIPDLKMASLSDQDLVHKAREAAEWVLEVDPVLERFEGLGRFLVEDESDVVY